MLTAKLLGNVRNTGWGCVGASTATGNAGCAVAEELVRGLQEEQWGCSWKGCSQEKQ